MIMAKKSTAARQSNAARRSQTSAKAAGVSLVRTPKAERDATPAAEPVSVARTRPTAPVARPSPAQKAARPEPKPEAEAARQQAAKVQAARVARARATQRARAVNVITPEHYSYVLNDLKLIGALALGMFAVILVLHFTLPS
jgi:hypothetical protein